MAKEGVLPNVLDMFGPGGGRQLDALELAAGWRAGCRTAALDLAPKLRSGRIEVEPSTRTQSLSIVLREIIATSDLARR